MCSQLAAVEIFHQSGIRQFIELGIVGVGAMAGSESELTENDELGV